MYFHCTTNMKFKGIKKKKAVKLLELFFVL